MPVEPGWWTAALVGEAKIIAPKHAAESRKFLKFICNLPADCLAFIRPREAKCPRPRNAPHVLIVPTANRVVLLCGLQLAVEDMANELEKNLRQSFPGRPGKVRRVWIVDRNREDGFWTALFNSGNLCASRRFIKRSGEFCRDSAVSVASDGGFYVSMDAWRRGCDTDLRRFFSGASRPKRGGNWRGCGRSWRSCCWRSGRCCGWRRRRCSDRKRRERTSLLSPSLRLLSPPLLPSLLIRHEFSEGDEDRGRKVLRQCCPSFS
jgi:hypothetical protein